MLIRCPECGWLYDDPEAEDENDIDICPECEAERIDPMHPSH